MIIQDTIPSVSRSQQIRHAMYEKSKENYSVVIYNSNDLGYDAIVVNYNYVACTWHSEPDLYGFRIKFKR